MAFNLTATRATFRRAARVSLALTRHLLVLTRMERGDLNVNMPQVNRQLYHLEGALNRLVGSIVFAAFLFGGVLLYQGGNVAIGYIFWALSGLTLLWMAFLSRGHSPWSDR